jgi:N-acyl-L-homoserine lactone synthetase
MSFQLKLARSSVELDRLFSARHRVFVDEMKYYPPAPEGRLFDRFDTFPTTRNVVATIGDRIVGGMRISDAAGVGIPGESLFDYRPHFPKGPARIGAGSMFFVDAAFRQTPGLVAALLSVGHARAAVDGFTHLLATCAPAAERVVLRLGYKLVAPRFFHEGKRLVVLPMVLDLQDLDERTRAFADAYRAWGLTADAVWHVVQPGERAAPFEDGRIVAGRVAAADGAELGPGDLLRGGVAFTALTAVQLIAPSGACPPSLRGPRSRRAPADTLAA